jgi:hypothetical protein
MRTDGRTEMAKLTGAFLQLLVANAPEKGEKGIKTKG